MKMTRGKSIEISDQLNAKSAEMIAQWIGCANVIRNQKTIQSQQEYTRWLAGGKPEESRPSINGQVSYLTKQLDFLKEIPCQIRRSAGAKWVDAVNAAKSGVRCSPKVKPKHKKRNCYVTNELFDVQALDDKRCLVQLKHDATQKTKGTYLAGFVMPFPKEEAGKALFLSRKGRKFWISMSFSKEFDVLPEREIKAELVGMTNEALEAALTGYDLGVKRQVTSSDGKVYHLDKRSQDTVNYSGLKPPSFKQLSPLSFLTNKSLHWLLSLPTSYMTYRSPVV
jgi:hypothetical protein